MQVRVGCEFVLETEAATPQILIVRARPDADQWLRYESRWVDPIVPIHECLDSFENACWRLTAPGGPFTIRYDAILEVDRRPDSVHPDLPLRPVQDLPDATLAFLLPSRYIESDQLIGRAWELFGDTPFTWARVQAVCDWIHANIRYQGGTSGPSTTALDVLRDQTGVCRDFALLGVGFCRALSIPARFACGYLPDIDIEPPDVPMDFHAWFEAYVGDGWYTFDARHNVPRVGRVLIGRGRDAADVAFLTSYGPTRLQQMTVWADEVVAGHPTGDPSDDADEREAAARVPATPAPNAVESRREERRGE